MGRDQDGKRSQPGRHPNSLANLEPTKFKPGDIGNPKGRNQYSYQENTLKTFARICDERIEGVINAAFDVAEEPFATASGDRRTVLERAMPVEKRIDLNIGSDSTGLLDRLDAYFTKRGEGSTAGEYSDPGSDGD